MKYIRDFWDKLMSNPIIRKAFIILGVFFLIVLIIILIASCSNRQKVYKYTELEDKMVELAKKRYSDKNKDSLPKNNGDYIEVSLQSFVEDGTFKDIQSIVQNNSACTGNVKIINNNGYYLYIPYLNCGSDYQSKTIYDAIVTEENIVNSGNGLYETTNEGEYIYKGDNVNNYLSLNGIIYRIIKINEDGYLRIIDMSKRESSKWDDRFNVTRNSNVGINDYIINNINSRIKDSIENTYYNDNIYNDAMRSYFVSTPQCVGKRSVNDSIYDDVECSNQIEAFPFGLLKANEYFKATLDSNCNSYDSESCINYNYLALIGSTWTITADKDTTYKAYKITSNGITLSNTINSTNIKVVTTINPDLLVTGGDGSQANPYTIKTFEKAVSSKK